MTPVHHIAIGRSFALDTDVAAREALATVTTQLGGAPDLLLVYATSGYDHDRVLALCAEAAPRAAVSGCSAEGIVTIGRADEVDHALGILGLRSERLAFDAYLVGGYGEDSAGCARELARQITATARPDPLVLVVMPDGLVGDCTAFLDTLSAELPPGLPVVGGAAADALRMDRTHQFCGTTVRSGAVAALLISGPGRAAVAVGHGCRPIGRTRAVTRAADGWVIEIDGKPAWDVFRQFLDGDPQDLRADGIMHLSVGQLPDATTDASDVVRTPMLLRQQDGALFFPGGGLDQGTRLRMLRRDPTQMKEAAVATAQELLADAGGQRPELVLQFDCSGRGKLLFGSCAAQEIVEPVQDLIGRDIPWLGFHTYGEIAPSHGRARYHNYTVALLALFPPATG